MDSYGARKVPVAYATARGKFVAVKLCPVAYATTRLRQDSLVAYATTVLDTLAWWLHMQPRAIVRLYNVI